MSCRSLPRLVTGCLIASVLPAACAPAPVFDDRIGIEGTPREPGSLAGTFAMRATGADIVITPIGDVDAAGTTYYLGHRTWDGTAYAVTLDVCSVINSESGGLLITTTDETVRAIPTVEALLHVDHATGAFEQDLAIELWGLRADAALPESDDDENVWDMDADGKVGVTGIASGIVSGEVYFVQRKTIALSGVTTKDGALGLADVVKKSRTLDATEELLKGQAERKPQPDPKESWFFEVPLDDAADCEDVVQAREDGDLPRLPPF